jgi:hypothetical protein
MSKREFDYVQNTAPKKKKRVVDKVEADNEKKNGYFPNFECGRVSSKYLEEGTRYHKIVDPIITVADLYKRLGIQSSTDWITLEKANQVYPLIRQRSPAWYHSRTLKNITVTGDKSKSKFIIGASVVADATGMWTDYAVKRFKGEKARGSNESFTAAMQGMEKKKDNQSRINMKGGEVMEEGFVLPYVIQHEKDLIFRESGSYLVPVCPVEETEEGLVRFALEKEPDMLVYVSPDNIWEHRYTGERGNHEIKFRSMFTVRKTTNDFSSWIKDPFPLVPDYYTGQDVFQKLALGVKFGRFTSGSLKGLNIFKTLLQPRYVSLLMKTLQYAYDTYIGPNKIEIPYSSSPFAGFNLYDNFLYYAQVYSACNDEVDRVRINPDWTEPGYESMWFDHPTKFKTDLRKTNPEQFKGRSIESIEGYKHDGQTDLDGFVKVEQENDGIALQMEDREMKDSGQVIIIDDDANGNLEPEILKVKKVHPEKLDLSEIGLDQEGLNDFFELE